MRRVEVKMQCLIDMVCKMRTNERASKCEKLYDGGTEGGITNYYVVGT